MNNSTTNLQTFKVLGEDSTKIIFQIKENWQTQRLIEVIRSDHAFKVLPSPNEDSVQIVVNIDQMDKSRIKYAPNSEFEIELSKFLFVPDAISCLKEIRTKRSGTPASHNAGRINTEFTFKTLYGWIRDGRVRFIKSSSIKNKRKESKNLFSEVEILKNERNYLKEVKAQLRREITFYKGKGVF